MSWQCFMDTGFKLGYQRKATEGLMVPSLSFFLTHQHTHKTTQHHHTPHTPPHNHPHTHTHTHAHTHRPAPAGGGRCWSHCCTGQLTGGGGAPCLLIPRRCNADST